MTCSLFEAPSFFHARKTSQAYWDKGMGSAEPGVFTLLFKRINLPSPFRDLALASERPGEGPRTRKQMPFMAGERARPAALSRQRDGRSSERTGKPRQRKRADQAQVGQEVQANSLSLELQTGSYELEFSESGVTVVARVGIVSETEGVKEESGVAHGSGRRFPNAGGGIHSGGGLEDEPSQRSKRFRTEEPLAKPPVLALSRRSCYGKVR